MSCNGLTTVGVLAAAFLVWLWISSPVHKDEVKVWLEDNELGDLRNHLKVKDLKTLTDIAEKLDLKSIKADAYVSRDMYKRLLEAWEKLDLKVWLEKEELSSVLPVLVEEGYESRKTLCDMTFGMAVNVSEKMSKELRQSFLGVWNSLKENCQKFDAVALEEEGISWGKMLLVVTLLLLVIGAVLIIAYLFIIFVLQRVIEAVIGAVIEGIAVVVVTVLGTIFAGIVGAITGRRVAIPQPNSGRLYNPARNTSASSNFSLGLVERIARTYLDVSKCRVEWNHKDNAVVGGSSVATVHFVCKNSSPYSLQPSDNFQCAVRSDKAGSIPHVVEPSPTTGHSSVKVSFTTRIAGKYTVDIKVKNRRIGNSVFNRNYCPGPVDASKTIFIDQTAVVVVTKGIYHAMRLVPRDSFGNTAHISQDNLTVEIKKNSERGEVINPECVVDQEPPNRYELLLKVERAGHYVGCVKHEGHTIGPPMFTIICLSDENSQIVEKNLKKNHLNTYYDAHQLVGKGKNKKVYCYISPRQLQVREYFLKLIPTRVFTCKVSPSTRIILHPEPEVFTLDDGFQKPVTLTSPYREILAATFYKFVLKNIGGSEKFQDKQAFFYNELKKVYCRQSRSDIIVTVSRGNLLESARNATKRFSSSDWCRKFVVCFRGEEGLDWGGLSREFFELLCVECFDASNKLFKRFNEENHQALVHPNHKRPEKLKLKYFHFAGKIVGKCLYESAMGNPLLVKARFTRSFLAQIIGLRIHYKYFETDDPDLYTTKIQYIKDNDVTGLDLVFAEEEFDQEGGNPTVVPLIENGEEIEVAEGNKMQYLDRIAQYRLAKCVKDEIEHFLKGLNEIVPDNLLTMFDETELELLMCGLDRVSFEDLKEHAILCGTNERFRQIVSWFWTITSSFTQEEMARLLQFVTGCSQLPPGGFKELSPKFQITSSPTRGRLPTAHTCFNQLCLPDYESCEQFQTALMMAINEGAEGFGLL